MRATIAVAISAALFAFGSVEPVAQGGPFRFSVTLPASAKATVGRPGEGDSIDGRLLVMLAKDPRAGEPRFQSTTASAVS